MSSTEITFAVISAGTTLISMIVTAMNAWGRVQMKNEVLQLRVYVSDHYVSKDALDQVVQRLERLLDRLEARIENRRDKAGSHNG